MNIDQTLSDMVIDIVVDFETYQTLIEMKMNALAVVFYSTSLVTDRLSYSDVLSTQKINW